MNCTHDGCDRPATGYRLCDTHRRRVLRFGYADFSAQWAAEESDAVRAANRIGYERMTGGAWSVASVPGFLDSIQRLYDQGYTQGDVSIMLGISRERVRQITVKHGLKPVAYNATMPRLWDDEVNRFTAVTKEEYAASVDAAYVAGCQADKVQGERLHAKAVHLLNAMRAAVKSLGRLPSNAELDGERWPWFHNYYRFFGSPYNAAILAGCRVEHRGGGGAAHLSRGKA